MQKIKRLDDLLEHDAERINDARRGEKPSHFQEQIDATADEIRKAFVGSVPDKPRMRAKLTDDA